MFPVHTLMKNFRTQESPIVSLIILDLRLGEKHSGKLYDYRGVTLSKSPVFEIFSVHT